MKLFDVKQDDGGLITGLSSADVLDLANSGRLAGDSMIRQQGQEGWRLIKSVPELAVHIGVGSRQKATTTGPDSRQDHALQNRRARWMVVWLVGVVLIIFAGVVGAVLYMLDGSAGKTPNGAAPDSVGEKAPAIVAGGDGVLSNVDIADLIDNTPDYRGANIRLKLTVGSSIHQDRGDSLRNYVGSQAQFYAFGKKGERLDITIVIPEALSVPKVGYGDHVVVTFNCSRGDLQWGNIATVIERP